MTPEQTQQAQTNEDKRQDKLRWIDRALNWDISPKDRKVLNSERKALALKISGWEKLVQ